MSIHKRGGFNFNTPVSNGPIVLCLGWLILMRLRRPEWRVPCGPGSSIRVLGWPCTCGCSFVLHFLVSSVSPLCLLLRKSSVVQKWITVDSLQNGFCTTVCWSALLVRNCILHWCTQSRTPFHSVVAFSFELVAFVLEQRIIIPP